MKVAELFHIKDITAQLPPYLPKHASFYISPLIGNDFVGSIKEALGSSYSYTYGPGLEVTKGKFDVIIDAPQYVFDINTVTSYAPRLHRGGVLILSLASRRNAHALFARNADTILFNKGFSVLFKEPTGKLSQVNNLSQSHPVNKLLLQIGRFFPNSLLYSPFRLVIYRKETQDFKKYESAHSIKNRAKRIKKRFIYKVKNHKVNDYLIKIGAFFTALKKYVKSVLLIHKFNFTHKIVPSIIQSSPTNGKKVLVIAMTYLQIGGVERVMLNIVKGLDRKKFIIHLVTTVPSANEWHGQFVPHVDSITHIPSIIGHEWPKVYQRRYLEAFVAKNTADTLFITNAQTAYDALPKIAALLPEISVYDLLHTHGTPRDNDAYLRTSMPFDTYITKRVVISEYLKNYYVEHYPVDPNKILVIYNGVDKKLLAFKEEGPYKDELLESIPNEKAIITYMGRLEFDKSPLRLVAIAKRLKELSIPACIVVVGDGSLEKQMQQEAAATQILDEFIYFYGTTDTPLPVMKHSDFTLLVSNAEGIPMSILESMSVGTPAVASAVGGIPEMIDDKKDGYLTDILSAHSEEAKIQLFVESIIEAVSLSSADRKNMSLLAREKIVNKFSSMAEDYESLLLSSNTKPDAQGKKGPAL